MMAILAEDHPQCTHTHTHREPFCRNSCIACSAQTERNEMKWNFQGAHKFQIPKSNNIFCRCVNTRNVHGRVGAALPLLKPVRVTQALSLCRPSLYPPAFTTALCIMRQLGRSEETRPAQVAKATSCSQGATRQRLAHFHFSIRQPQNLRWTCGRSRLELAQQASETRGNCGRRIRIRKRSRFPFINSLKRTHITIEIKYVEFSDY